MEIAKLTLILEHTSDEFGSRLESLSGLTPLSEASGPAHWPHSAERAASPSAEGWRQEEGSAVQCMVPFLSPPIVASTYLLYNVGS